VRSALVRDAIEWNLMSRRLLPLLVVLAVALGACSSNGVAGPDAAPTTPAGRGSPPGSTAPGGSPAGSSVPGTTGSTGPAATAPPRVLPSGRPGPALPAEERAVTIDLFAAPADIDPALVRDQLAYAASQGANTVYLSASEVDLANDAKLRAALDLAHDLGLVAVLDPYIGGTFRGDAGGSAGAVLAAHPEWQATSRQGVAAPVPAINSAAYRDSVLETLDRFLALDIDGVVFDQPSFPQLPLETPGDYFPYDADAQLQFESRFGHVLPARETAEVVQFRHDSMKSFLEDLTIEVRHQRPDVSTRLLVPADLRVVDTRAGTDDWKELASIQALDALHVAAPGGPDDAAFALFVHNQDRLIEAVGSQQASGMWIAAEALGDGSYAFISAEIADARKHGVTQLVVARSDQHPNAQPEAAWAEIRKGFGIPEGQAVGPPPAPLSTTTTTAPVPPTDAPAP
jgi:hypothetical protein